MKYFHQIKAVFVGLILSASLVPLVMADDTEIYTSSSIFSDSTNPNILFVVDTSSSMGTSESLVKPSYDFTKIYEAAAPFTDCEADGIYFVTDGQLPDCTIALENYFNFTALECDHALVSYTADDTTDPKSGVYSEYGSPISPKQVGSLLLIGS